jgi:RNA polymerase sigma-70 factor (ECF subfamily)
MDERWLAERFEEHRDHLRKVAYRMLGSRSEAEDAVQETWLRLSRSDRGDVHNLGGWLTTVVGRVCLDMLRSRASRREEPLDTDVLDAGTDPEDEAVLADSVGAALLVVLDTLAPAERLAFVLHDMFAVPFDQIAAILHRSPNATKMLASRARRRVPQSSMGSDADPARRREVVAAFLAAARDGDFDALLALLAPEVVVRADAAVSPRGAPAHAAGARTVAEQALSFARRARFARLALADGAMAIAVVPHGRLTTIMLFEITHGKITGIDISADPERLRRIDLTLIEDDYEHGVDLRPASPSG